MASETPQRTDIQGLRAFAALAVLGYHFFPNQVWGGFIGVDIFFVISGYLITTQLRTALARDGQIRLATFYARRIRRLLPAAYLVLVAAAPACYYLLSPSRWHNTFTEIGASALYAENWVLANNSVDYLAAENAASPVQHYWSLAVEGQIYVVWPLLLIVALWFVRAHPERGTAAMRAVVSAVLVVSLVWCVWQTYSPAASVAYFSTFTRVWEFALGGLCALIPSLPSSGRSSVVLSAAGWGLLVAAVLVTRQDTPFPGWMALLPTLGTFVAILANDNGPNSLVARLIAWRPVQYLGDISYPIYLWHWPIVVLILPVLYEIGPGRLLSKLLAISITLVLAALTYRFVETPIRGARLFKRSAPIYVSALAALALVAATCAPAFVLQARSSAQGESDVDDLLSRNVSCFGADDPLGATHPCESAELDGVMLPAIINRYDDTGSAFDCYSTEQDATLRTCTVGSDAPDAKRIAIVGDSHAAMLVPGLERAALARNWNVTVLVGWSGAAWITPPGDDDDAPLASRMRAVRKILLEDEPFDAIVVTQWRRYAPQPDALAAAWEQVTARSTKVLAVVDNPMLTAEKASWVDASHTAADLPKCALTPAEAWAWSDHSIQAAQLSDRDVAVADFSSAYCQGDTCPIVVGHVLVYRDDHHITATFSKTLAPYLAAALNDLLYT